MPRVQKKLKTTNLTALQDLVGLVNPYRDGAAGTNLIKECYLLERDAIKHPNQLRGFVRRWQAIWLLSPGSRHKDAHPDSCISLARKPITWAITILLGGNYNAKKVMRFVHTRDGEITNPLCRDFILACHISVPLPLLHANLLSDHYGVGCDLGLVRLYLDTYPELDNAWR